MLNGTPTFADLQDAFPTLARGLKQLLDYPGDDVTDVFCRTFEVDYKVFDEVYFLFISASCLLHPGLFGTVATACARKLDISMDTLFLAATYMAVSTQSAGLQPECAACLHDATR